MRIDGEILSAFDDYHEKSLMMQKYHFQGNKKDLSLADLHLAVDDDLIANVPIYDMLDRRYAAFNSFLEALNLKHEDPKGNGKHFMHCHSISDLEIEDAIALFYLFRLCGSGINYKPNVGGNPLGTHGFGNFWVIDSILEGRNTLSEWLEDLELLSKPFTDSKGYLLPMISYKEIPNGHMRKFILEETRGIVNTILNLVICNKQTIMEVVDVLNIYLNSRGFKKQFFVLSATAADIAEYFPNIVCQNSMIYAGTNAKKCIKALFKKDKPMSQLKFESECLEFLSDRYGAPPYSVEDSRLCDVHRYFQDFQSKHHIEKNGGKIYTNNSILKSWYSEEEYQSFVNSLQ